MMNVNESASAGALFLWENWGRNGRFPPISYVIPRDALLYLRGITRVMTMALWEFKNR